MSIFNNKSLKVFVSFLLIFVIMFSFTIKPYAEAIVMGGIAFKVFVTILASMGILTYANSSSGGVSAFWEGFKDYAENTKGVHDILSLFAQQGIKTFYNKSKMSVSNLVSLIKEYYLTLRPEIPPFDFPDLEGSYVDFSHEYTGRANSYGNNQTFDLGSGYTLQVNIARTSNGFQYQYYTRHNGNIVSTNTRSSFRNFNEPISILSGSTISVNTRIQLSDDILSLQIYLIDITKNNVHSGSVSLPFPELLEHSDKPLLPDIGVQDFPTPLSVPNALPFPWAIELEKLGSISGNIGKTIEELIESVNDLSIESYVDDLLDLPKQIIDSYPIPEVVVDEGGIITDIEVPEVTVPDIGIGGLAGLLTGFFDWIKSWFTVPDNIALDFSSLKDLGLERKFPFSLPTDLKRMATMLVAPPKPLKFETMFLGNRFVLDFAQFESMALISRSFFTLLFGVAVLMATRRFRGDN